MYAAANVVQVARAGRLLIDRAPSTYLTERQLS